LNIAYLMTVYPMTSTTFIRREIEALEDLGVNIHRHAIRKWDGQLVDSRDILEIGRTRYLLTENIGPLLIAVFKELCLNPRGFFKAVAIWLALLRKSRGNLVKVVAWLMQAAHFRQISKSQCIDHVHVHFATNATAVAMLSHVMGGPSYSFTVHGPDEFTNSAQLSFDIKVCHAAFVNAISNYCKEQLLCLARRADHKKITVARCGIALEEFTFEEAWRPDNDTFICVGRLCSQKGQILIPAAVAALRNDFPLLKVILVGDGESRHPIETAIARYNVGDMIEMRGWIANREVLEMIRSCRALLLPSYAEGLPIVIMEALALGRPVISTRIAGIPELVDDSCGWLFPAGDEQALIATMRAALQCKASVLAGKGAAGRARVEQLHDRRRLAKQLCQSFKKVVADPRLQLGRRLK
jgi:colanic acid/amylovoran biosynthesis glycosyltransferase